MATIRNVTPIATRGPSVDQAMQQQALAQALYQRSTVPNMPQVGGPVQAQYGAGNALVDLANTLASAWNVKRADNKVKKAQDAESEMRGNAIADYQRSAPAEQMGAASLENLRNAPEGQLPEPVMPRDEATANMSKAFGPQMQAQLASALVARDMAPAVTKNVDLGDRVAFITNGRETGSMAKGAAPTQEKPLDAIAQVNADLKAGRITPEQASARIAKLNATDSGVTVNMPDTKYPNAFQEALGKSDVAQLDKYRSSAEGAASMVKTLTELKQLSPTAMSGGGANARAQVANWLSGWTGVDVVDPGVLSDTQKYNSIVTQSVLDKLGGSLGAGVSNADTAFIKETVPKLEYSQEAREQLIDYMSKRAGENMQLYEDARNYGETHNGLKGFRPHPVERSPDAPKMKIKQNPDGSMTYSP